MTDEPSDAQRADHYQHLYEQASGGRCGHSGMPLAECKWSICDCFDFEWVKPEDPRTMKEWLWDRVWYPWVKRPYLWVAHPRRMMRFRSMRLTGEQIYELGNYQSVGPIRDED